MAWKNKTSTPEEIAEELKINLQKNDSARLLVLGTETSEGYTMRMTLKDPEAITGIIYNHAVKTGEVNEALHLAEHLIRIGTVARKLIHDEINKRKTNN